MEIGRFFTPPPRALVRGYLLRGQGMLGQPIQKPKQRVRGTTSKDAASEYAAGEEGPGECRQMRCLCQKE